MLKRKKTVLALLMLFILLPNASAQNNEQRLSTEAVQFKISRLAPAQATDEAVFSIDQPGTVSIETIASSANIQTSVRTPSGKIITPTNASSFGAKFIATGGDAAAEPGNGFSLPSITKDGYHYLYIIPSQESGNYTVSFAAPAGLAGEVALLTEARWDSPITAKLIATDAVVVQGNPAVLSAALFNGTQPVTGAAVEITIQDADRKSSKITLRDNGADDDDKAGDGLYSGEFIPAAAGRYSLFAVITGNTGGSNIGFVRHTATEITVIPASGKLAESITEQVEDDNFDGLIDRVNFNIGTQITTPGEYQAFVHLKTASGKPIVGSGFAELSAGNGEVKATIDASAFREVGEDGPYTIESVTLDFLYPNIGYQQVDEQTTGMGKTGAYLISKFHRKPLILTGKITEQGFDDNNNRQFDRFRVAVQVDVLLAGYYQWNMKLSNQNSDKIAFARGQGYLSSGLNDVAVEFDGLTIGQSRANGPFKIDDMLLFGPKSLVAAEVGQTLPYRSGQFEGGIPDDTTPPTLQVRLSPDSIWPPNHKMVTITATITVSDDIDPQPRVKLLSIVSNEPDSTGPGDDPNDIQGAEIGTDDRSFSVRAERLGSGSGRTYTVKYEARDAAGNVTTITKQVIVPHDQRK
jgi:hypothetical protein